VNRRRFLPALAGIVLLCGLGGAALAQVQWVQLGVRTVNILIDQDTIPVTAAEGTFDRLGFRVRGTDLFVFSVRINFGNGDVQEIAIGETIPQGDQMREIDLTGNNRIIASIVLTYTRPVNFAGATVVEIWGRR
jgi:hypothetical protein